MARIEIPTWIPSMGDKNRGDLAQGETHRTRLDDTMLALAGVWAEDRLRGLAILTAAIELLIANEVQEQRRDGRSWREIGDALGISKQAAQQKFGKQT